MSQAESPGANAIRKIKWRLLPFLFVLYIINIMDRGNLSYAALTMNSELRISAAEFGALYSIFFIPYLIFEVPSNVLLHRFGARKWIARIMITWGLVTCASMFSGSFKYIATMRFLLGMMEAGFFPGILFYFTLWFPQNERGKVIALFMMALPASGFIVSPISGWIIDNVNWLGYSGWRWLFFLEGAPAIIFGILTWVYLDNSPRQAQWLTDAEKDWIITALAKEDAVKSGGGRSHPKFREMFADGRVWRIGVIYFSLAMSAGTMAAWTAIIIKDFAKVSNTGVGLLGMIPSLFALIAMPLWAWHSDKTGERKVHTIISISVSFLGALLAALAASPVLKMTGLVLIYVGSNSMMGPFWAIPTLYLAGASAAVGTAVINSCNSLGAFIATFISGFLQTRYGFSGILLFASMGYLLGIILTATLPLKRQAPGIRAIEIDSA